ncbi:MAG TPA: ABC transporter substrate-binding protein [Ramlibacter sp.]|uniref:ABC transporter substrate-binding protein n=1 Tax=Ramlibacter sp. TaxID=1917967 RepID=UPI002D4A9AFB|nr:ABC transporter substrate-binding protein [Ramlibacter sp.]HZY20186.1 ABC transporter substrate-binding protein [Ramlibacter sp.]
MDRRTFLMQGASWSLAAATASSAFGASGTASAGNAILIGQSAALTGPQAGFGTAMRDGLQAAFAFVNRTGGVNGRPLQLLALDDVGDKAKTEANVKTLVDDKRIVGLSGFTTRPCSEAGAAMAAKEEIALVGAFSGTPMLYSEQAATTFTTRASYEAELLAIVRHYRMLGFERFGFVHLEDAKSTNVPLLEKILARAGGKLVVTAGLDRKGPSMNDTALKTLDASKPDMVIILANNAPLTGFLREYAPRTVVMPKMVISFVDREKLLADLGKDAAGVGFSVVVPEATREKYWVVREFIGQAREAKMAINPVSLEGFVTGLAVAQGLKQARNDTRVSFIEGMTRAGGFDLGYTSLRFGRGERAGSQFVDLSLATRNSGII